MPTKPPKVLIRIEEKERISAPQSSGMKLPIVEPTKSPNQMKVFLLMCLMVGEFCYNENMLKITGNDIWRSGQRVGWVEGNYVRAHDGKKLGYFEGNFIYGMDGHKLAYVEGDYLRSESSSTTKISIDKVNESIEGGMLPVIGKCAVYMLIGA